MKLVKKRTVDSTEFPGTPAGVGGRTIDRRGFLRGAGLAAGGAAVAVGLPSRMMRRADAAAGNTVRGDS